MFTDIKVSSAFTNRTMKKKILFYFYHLKFHFLSHSSIFMLQWNLAYPRCKTIEAILTLIVAEINLPLIQHVSTSATVDDVVRYGSRSLFNSGLKNCRTHKYATVLFFFFNGTVNHALCITATARGQALALNLDRGRIHIANLRRSI